MDMIRAEIRFHDKYIPEPNSGCWIWISSIHPPTGYGMIRWGENKNARAHRISWEINKGPIPVGLYVCHRCDNRICVNPDHLFVGTAKDNADDCISKGRNSRGRMIYTAVLFPEQVLEIRRRYSAKLNSQRELAREYGVTRGNIKMILRRITWKHI